MKKIFIIVLSVIAFAIIVLIIVFMVKKRNVITIEKEVLEENMSILISPLNDECEFDECVTYQTINLIFKYFEKNDYEKTLTEENIYYRKADMLIKIVIASGNDVENRDNFNYVFNRYTTLDDLKKILNDQKISVFTGEEATEIAVLNYHFFYDKTSEECNQSICLDIESFEKQLKYLKDNNFKTLTIEEFRAWMYGEIALPKKSVLITVDDGAMGTSAINGNKLIPLLEKYEINATLFLITGWWKKNNYESAYLDIQSHSDLMHEEGVCSNKERGAKLLCSSYDEKIADLKKSIEKLNSNTAFCFPFYAYDQEAIKALKELDFKLAFIGGNKKANQNLDKYQIPRYIIYKTTSLNSFKNMVN